MTPESVLAKGNPNGFACRDELEQGVLRFLEVANRVWTISHQPGDFSRDQSVQEMGEKRSRRLWWWRPS